jgi:fructose-bisphosphate aldolase class I
MVAPGKGILAADESTPTIKKRFDSIGVESTEETRRSYRDMLFTTPGLGDHISGVIMFDETLRQSSSDGTPFPKVLEEAGTIPGIKVDTGAKDLAGFPGEKITEGLDGLRGRLEEYVGLGARFTKWRAVITIGDGIPTSYCIRANGEALARYAALAQEAGLVPMVEPEILMEGNHTIERCAAATNETLSVLFRALHDARVDLEGTILKTNMIVPGKDCATHASSKEIAEHTLRVLRETVPPAIPGIAFLSGGQGDIEATENLQAINELAGGDAPWRLTYSYGRALQAPSLKAWAGNDANREEGQRQLQLRARCNGAASDGLYSPDMESAA